MREDLLHDKVEMKEHFSFSFVLLFCFTKFSLIKSIFICRRILIIVLEVLIKKLK